MPGAVELGRVAQVAGQPQEGLPEEEGAEPRRQEGHGQARVRVVPAETHDRVEVCEEGDLERHHHGGKEQDEECLLEREVQEGEGICGGDGRRQLTDHDHGRHDEAVEEIAPEVALRPRRRVARPLGVEREEDRRLGHHLIRAEQRVHHRDVDREEHDHGEHTQEEVATDEGGTSAAGRAAVAADEE